MNKRLLYKKNLIKQQKITIKNLVELDKELVKNLEDAGVKINEVNLPEFAKLVEPIYKNIGITEEFYKQLMDEMEKIRTEQK